MEFLTNNWVLMVCSFALCIYIGFAVYGFIRQPKAEQVAAAKQWLLWAVNQAESELGNIHGTGPLKLRMCYDLFVTKFPWLARIISFETFAQWVDEALDALETYLNGMPEDPGSLIGFCAQEDADE